MIVASSKPLSIQAEAQQERLDGERRYDELAQVYGELKVAWDTRGPRDEDVAAMDALRARLAEREMQLATAEQRFHELRNVRPAPGRGAVHRLLRMVASAQEDKQVYILSCDCMVGSGSVSQPRQR
jgi:hypothetical protein